ncbi:phenylalanine--tRNA ligase subunit alpha [Candidatus Bathyarchaeota archaeon]|nr:phenylalanine--tRNA ligase subunit alpha [Candidatus Bathyarchaeota archaeon]
MVELERSEGAVLMSLGKLNGKAEMKKLLEESKLNESAAMRAALALHQKGFLKIEEFKATYLKLNDEGLAYAVEGLPERKLVKAVIKLGGKALLEEAAAKAEINLNFLPLASGWIARKNLGKIIKENGKVFIEAKEEKPETLDETLLKKIFVEGKVIAEKLSKEFNEALQILRRRNLLSETKKTLRILHLTEEGWKLVKAGVKISIEASELTPELIIGGKWRQVNLKKYNIQAPPPLIWPGKKQPYKKFLDDLKLKLTSLGFKEMTGPLIELMFFNCDALFMPQDHPAREIHDIFFIKEPEFGSLTEYENHLMNVKATHENGWITNSKGWGYNFSVENSKRLILRSHGTAISVRTLISGKLEIPGKYFSIARCYRPEVTDKTHLTEFNQVEGIVVGENLTFKDLLGILKTLAIEIAEADEVTFKPDYFPFTEPSVELAAYKRDYGWLEFGGAGIFRPEVTLPLGIKTPVLAWGLGVDRLFMMKAGIDDIRELFTQNLEWLRCKEVI